MSSNKRNLPRLNYNESFLVNNIWNENRQISESSNITPKMPNLSANDKLTSPLAHGSSVSNLSYISEFDENVDIATAEAKLNIKVRVIEKYKEKCDANYLLHLSQEEYK